MISFLMICLLSFCFLSLLSLAHAAMTVPVSRRGPWESGLNKQGIQLADRSELCLADGSNILSCGSFCASTLHEGSRGLTFVVFATLKRNPSLRTQAACAGIINGFQRDRCIQLGIEAERVEQVVLTLQDETTHVTEPRACTLVNFSLNTALFIRKTDDIIDIELADDDKITFSFEMRKGDSDPQEWASFSETLAFKNYTEEILEGTGCSDKACWQSVFRRDDFVTHKVVAPAVCKPKLYPHSGQKSVQIKCVRSNGDPPEPGFDIIRIPKPANFVLHKIWSQGSPQAGWMGCFSSQFGVFLRFADAHLAKAREQWLGEDVRFNKDNLTVKLTKQWLVQGSGPGTTLPDVQLALNTVGWTVVPLKCIQTNGFSSCIVASDTDPPRTKYVTNLGSLLISPQKHRARSQHSRRKGGEADSPIRKETPIQQEPLVAKKTAAICSSDPWAAYNSASLTKRVDVLEKKISGIEIEQKTTREIVDDLKTSQQSGFDNLLAAIHDLKKLQGASASSSPVPSPPSKLPKTS